MEETKRLDLALDALLRGAIADDKRAADPDLGSMTATPFRITSFDRMPTLDDVHFAALLSNPVGAACRQGIWAIGRQLFRTLGSTDAMREVAERVSDMDPPNWARRVSIIDGAWNGIGSDSDRWWS